MTERPDVTQLLKKAQSGDRESLDRLLPVIYDELRRVAANQLQKERADHTLQATALVHEAYIRLVDWEKVSWQNRAHFFAVAAQIMRKILVDHAREKRAQKRDFGQKLSLDEAVSFPNQKSREVDLIGLDAALEKLAKFDKTQSKIVELRFFGGLTIEETAHALKISPSTVKREWTVAKTWLFREIGRNDG